MRKEGEVLFHSSAAVLDSHLKDREYLAGNALTLADFSVAAMLIYARPARLPLEKYENIRAWFGQLEKLESWKMALPVIMPS